MPIHNLKQSQLSPVDRRVRRMESQSPLGNSSVSTGKTRFLGLVSLEVVGSGKVTGLWDVDGELRVGGDINLTGDMTVSGAGKIAVGTMTFEPAGTYGGRVTATIFQVNGKLEVVSSSVFAAAVAINAAITATGQATFQGGLTAPLPFITPTGHASNVWVDPSTGKFWRTT